MSFIWVTLNKRLLYPYRRRFKYNIPAPASSSTPMLPKKKGAMVLLVMGLVAGTRVGVGSGTAVSTTIIVGTAVAVAVGKGVAVGEGGGGTVAVG